MTFKITIINWSKNGEFIELKIVICEDTSIGSILKPVLESSSNDANRISLLMLLLGKVSWVCCLVEGVRLPLLLVSVWARF